MASKISGSRKLKKNTLPKFEEDVYSRIPSGELIVFSVHYLIERKIQITLDDIVSICFLLFPHKFGLKKYPKWPDSALVGRRWGDSRRKGYIAANANLEYKLTSKGSSLLKQVEKILGVAAPKPTVKIQPVQPKEEAVIPVKKIQSAVSKDKITKPVKRIRKAKALTPKAPAVIQKKIAQPVQEEKATQLELIKKIRPVRAKKVSPAPVKQAETPEIKVRPVTQARKTRVVQEKKASPPAPIKKIRPVRAKKVSPAPVKQAQIPEIKAHPIIQAKKKQAVPVSKPAEKAQPITPTRKVKPNQVKKTKPAKLVIVRQDNVEKTQPEKANYAAPGNVTREARERAGKFTRMMERSDAYIHYKKNGNNSKISEFDFRSLLLCTMESSPETLARNVELFKGYAGIHNRQDLIVFLIFCKDKFSHLLKPQNKSARKAKK